MRSAAAGQRIRQAIIIALVAAAALGSYWTLEVIRQNKSELPSAIPKDEPDYTVEKFNFVRMSISGEARYNISGSKLTHFPADDTFEIQQPLLHNLADAAAPLTVSADRALIDYTIKKVQLHQHVQADRPASANSKEFHLTTDYLLVLPDDDLMQTDRPVKIVQDRTTITGVGMLVNNATRDFHLYSQVRGVIEPPRR